LTLPVTLLTFGLFLFAINSLIVLIAAEIVPGFHVAGFGSGILFSVLVSLANSVLLSSGSDQ
jgi:putative membrane protein